MKTARSVILKSPRDLVVEEIPVPIIPGEIEYVEMRACGICGSDIRYFDGENPWSLHTLGKNLPSPPNMVLGHEVAGVVKTQDSERRVAILAFKSCGVCGNCKTNHENLCPNMEHFGHSAGWHDMDYYPGGMADRFTIWKGFAHEIPESVEFEEATFLDGLAVALHSLDQASFVPGMRVGVIGLGPIGMLAAQAALSAGAQSVVCCDTHALPITLGNESGIEHCVRGDSGDMKRHLQDVISTRLDIVLDTVGSEESIADSLEMLDNSGTAALLAVHDNVIGLKSIALSGERKLVTSSNNCYPDFPRAIDLLASGKMKVKPLITHRFPLDRAKEGFELMLHKKDEEVYKVVITP